MNKDRLMKLIYDLEITTKDINKSMDFIRQFSDHEELILEFENSLKYKFLNLFIIYEEFISMLLKEYNLYEIAISVDHAIHKLKSKHIITDKQAEYLDSARVMRNKIGHRYKQPQIEVIIEFLEGNRKVKKELFDIIKGYMTK